MGSASNRVVKYYRLFLIIVIFPLLIGGIFLGIVDNSKAAVDLRYFRATAQETKITIEWGTAAELDHAGFYVQRSSTANGPYQRISQFIYAQGDSLVGANYEYEDQNIMVGITYWYRLESIDTNQRSNFSDPISVGYKLASLTNTPTRTPTGTLTWTPSPTIRPNVTLRPTNTLLPTNTFPPTNTQESEFQTTETVKEPLATDSVFVDQNINGAGTVIVSTLVPFPTITIQFPTTQTPSIRTPFDGYLVAT